MVGAIFDQHVVVRRLVQEVADESRDEAVVTYKHKYKESIDGADSEHKEVTCNYVAVAIST